jgi:hypothetical protein
VPGQGEIGPLIAALQALEAELFCTVFHRLTRLPLPTKLLIDAIDRSAANCQRFA